MTTILHIVCFALLPSLTEAEKKEFCDDMLALKSKCIMPTTQKPYILSSTGGADSSPETYQGGLTHAFVVEYASAEDRDYYSLYDPAHKAFVEKYKTKWSDIRVIDIPGLRASQQ